MSADDHTKLHVVEGVHLVMLGRVMKRLYTEARMNGDEMRDAAHQIRAVVEYAESFVLDEDDLKRKENRT